VTYLTNVVQQYQDAPSASRDMVNANVNLAISLRTAGKAQEAATLLDEAFARLSATLPEGPDTLACRLSRAVNLLALRDRRAQSELSAVHEAYNSWLGPDHPHTIVCLNNIAMAMRVDDRISEAVELINEAAAKFEVALGPDHPYTLAARTNLAVCAADSGRLEDGRQLIEAVVEPITQRLGPNHPDTLRTVANQALIVLRLGADEQAGLIESIARELAEQIGYDHPALSTLSRHRLLHRMIDPQPF